MNHSRKMVLVPEHTLERLQQRQHVSTAPLTSRLNGLDQEIQQVLKNDTLSEDERARQYNQSLQNYLTYYNQRKHQPLKVKMESSTDSKKQEEKTDDMELNKTPPVPTEQPQENVLERDIIRALPRTLKDRGKLLLETIKQNPDIMKWDERGQLILDGKPQQGSHIGDLIDDSLRTRKGTKPIGLAAFTKGLAKMNAPEHLIRNKDRKNALRELKSGVQRQEREENEWFPTPNEVPGPIRSKTRNPTKKTRQRWLTFS